jgi:hypothetical protein
MQRGKTLKKKQKLKWRLTNNNLNLGEENENVAELQYQRWKVRNRQEAKDLLHKLNPGEFRFRVGYQDASVQAFFKIFYDPFLMTKPGYNPVELVYKAKPGEGDSYAYRIDSKRTFTEEEELHMNQYRLNSDNPGVWEVRRLHPVEFFKEEPEIPLKPTRFFIQPYDIIGFRSFLHNLPHIKEYKRQQNHLTRLSGRKKLETLRRLMLTRMMTKRQRKGKSVLPNNVLGVIQQQLGTQDGRQRGFENPAYLRTLNTSLFQE